MMNREAADTPVLYQDKIKTCVKHLLLVHILVCANSVTNEMAKRGWLSPLDSVIDIADIMRDMRGTM